VSGSIRIPPIWTPLVTFKSGLGLYSPGGELLITDEAAWGISERTCVAFAASLLITLLLLPLAAFGVAADPVVGDYFEYDYNTFVDQGTGSYYQYQDSMTSHSRYVLESIDDEWVTVHGTGSWRFEGSDGGYDSGSIDVTFAFSTLSRRYQNVTDLDVEYYDPAVWFWIPPHPTVGQVLRILDTSYTVTDTDHTKWFGVIPRKVDVVYGSGSYVRDDAYGTFQAEFEDTCTFDRKTGYISSESYVEYDTAPSGTFRYRAEVKVTSSSYELPIDWITLLSLVLGIPGAIFAVVVIVWRIRRGPSRFLMDSNTGPRQVVMRKVKDPSEIETMKSSASRYFTPFLSVIASRARIDRDPVIVAVSGQEIVGLATLDRESMLGSLFATDEKVGKALIRRLRMSDFFVEVIGPNWDLQPAKRIDAFEILELRNPRPTVFDAKRVRSMTHGDIGKVTSISQAVYGGKSSKWIRSCFEGGDVAFVAINGREAVGFGFATVSGDFARLHTLTVLPQSRARGLGSELMAARLTVLAMLGVDRVIVEISKHNSASMRVAAKAGFTRVGETAYYSRRPAKADSVMQRRL
jgi:ribosomal protein S18 acetylase RimI-like enzyme